MAIDQLLKSKKVIICCGSGGVGKTTLSASLGVRAADLGLRVLILTIDPARRLANSLGLDKIEEFEKRISPEKFKGALYASMLDVKKTFDDFIVKMAPSEAAAERVLKNNVYIQISTALNGSQEYTALERLLQAHNSGAYDLVILDTPPTKHAIDFLNAPVKIHSLFQDSVIKWFVMPFTTLDKMSLGLMNRGTKAALKLFEKVAGSEFLSMLTEFFSSIRDWQKVLRDRTAEVHRLLTSSQTGFILVTGYNSAHIEEAKSFEMGLKKGGYLLSAIIVNRAFPQWERAMDPGLAKEDGADSDPHTAKVLERLKNYYDQLLSFYSRHQEAFRDFASESRQNVTVLRLPEMDQDIHDLESLKKLADRLESSTFQKRSVE